MAEPRQGDGRGPGRPEQTEEAAPLGRSSTNFTHAHGFILSDCRLTIQGAVTDVPFFASWRIHQITPIAMGIPKMIRTHSRIRTIDPTT